MSQPRRPFAQQRGEDERQGKPSLPVPRVEVEEARPPKPADAEEELVRRGVEGLKAVLDAVGLDPGIAEKVKEKLRSIADEVARINERISALEQERGRLLAERERLLRLLKAFSEVRAQ
ncbi:hypothetical protein [Thermofilum pendens]|uniref:Uncharacterized protein n=1 Tax=Thermofilum pendens (strain DSM 2475 / Hrk 5) TaxID=368408 RepID=A1RY48_THEPD|nr:hypothetical protein [Thermofilum pendens]ABL78128.1 hypothetical protein Tpen_0726 [Thermofilum pendens Hrk 5]